MYTYHSKNRIYQGDILNNIEVKLDFEVIDEELIIKTREFPYVVIMTQDCDLEQDYNNRANSTDNQSNCLLSILFCPAFLSDDLREGNHLEKAGLKIKRINGKLWDPIKKNNNERYYFLEGEEVHSDYEEIVVPDLVIDFKHYQTIQRDELYTKIPNHYFISINPLFREKISDRFTHYLGRIGLPEIKKSAGYGCGTSCD